MQAKADLGSVSNGTHRHQDLADSFWSALHRMHPKMAEEFALEYPWFFSFDGGTMIEIRVPYDDELGSAGFCQRLASARVNFVFVVGEGVRSDRIMLIDKWKGPEDDDKWWETEECAYMINEDFFDVLDGFAPAYCYFGASAGDGADFGFWFSKEDFDTAVEDGRVVIVPDGKPWKTTKTGYHSDDMSVIIEAEWPDSREFDIPKEWTAIKDKTGHTTGIRRVVDADRLDHIAEVNDRGNITIFNLEGQEILAVV